jgi:hypothetical protein
LKFWRISGGFDKVEKAIITFADFQIFEHHDKIR